MIIVSDSSPLHYLILTETAHVLPTLYGNVVIPPAVHGELQHPSTPEKVRQWMEAAPDWLEVRAVSAPERIAKIDPDNRLDAGEQEAISLALELGARLLCDEQAGRKVAVAQGLSVTGLLGVLEAASIGGLINLSATLERLRHTNFYVREELLVAMLERERARAIALSLEVPAEPLTERSPDESPSSPKPERDMGIEH